jgi:hypothetical protein
MPKNPDNQDGSRHEGPKGPDENIPPDRWDLRESAENIDIDQWVQVHQTHYDRDSNNTLVTTLVLAIAEAKDVDPLDHSEMPPLYESFDTSALETMFFDPSGAGSKQKAGGAVTFQYTGCKIVLRADGWIFVYEPQ